MELYKELLLHLLEKEDIRITFPNLKLDAKDLIQVESYNALQKIKHILEDDTLSDSECFEKIEAIVSLFEYWGSGCGSRHNF